MCWKLQNKKQKGLARPRGVKDCSGTESKASQYPSTFEVNESKRESGQGFISAIVLESIFRYLTRQFTTGDAVKQSDTVDKVIM